MNYEEIYDAVEALREAIVASTTPVEPQDIGLDDRCGAILCGDDFIASLMPRMLDHYGGFEYIKEGMVTIGEMKIYFAKGNARVQWVLDFHISNEEQDNEQ